MDAALGFGGRNALHAVDAGFVFEVTENFVASDFENDFFETTDHAPV